MESTRLSVRSARHSGGVNRKQRRALRAASTRSEVDGLTRPVPEAALSRLVPRLHSAQLPAPAAPVRDIAAIKQEIVRDLAPYDAMQIIADVLAFTAFSRTAARDLEPAATCEYIAAVLLERSGPPTVSGLEKVMSRWTRRPDRLVRGGPLGQVPLASSSLTGIRSRACSHGSTRRRRNWSSGSMRFPAGAS